MNTASRVARIILVEMQYRHHRRRHHHDVKRRILDQVHRHLRFQERASIEHRICHLCQRRHVPLQELLPHCMYHSFRNSSRNSLQARAGNRHLPWARSQHILLPDHPSPRQQRGPRSVALRGAKMPRRCRLYLRFRRRVHLKRASKHRWPEKLLQ